MRKFFIAFMLLFSLSFLPCNAQTYWYQSTAFSYKHISSYGRWTDWAPWEQSSVRISIDVDRDLIKIFSPMTQIYFVTRYDGKFTDSSGGEQVQYSVVDQDRDTGKIRLRVERNGNSQLYVEFSDVMWVYNVVRIN